MSITTRSNPCAHLPECVREARTVNERAKLDVLLRSERRLGGGGAVGAEDVVHKRAGAARARIDDKRHAAPVANLNDGGGHGYIRFQDSITMVHHNRG